MKGNHIPNHLHWEKDSIKQGAETGKKILEKKGVTFPDQVVRELFFHCFSKEWSREQGAGMASYPKEGWNQFFWQIHQATEGVPLQYLLGKWDFFDLEFYLGPGVLIPRGDTERLCQVVLDLKMKSPVILGDLCSGSGCIGLTLEKHLEVESLFLLEKSPEALAYLEQNVTYHQSKGNIVFGDIFQTVEQFPADFFHLLVSNPPYLTQEEMKHLSAQVEKEPKMALLGGEDGLDFYRNILRDYTPKLKSAGYLVVEIGYTQGEVVTQLFAQAGYGSVTLFHDYGGNPRVVLGQKMG